jgi:hypothetical protein
MPELLDEDLQGYGQPAPVQAPAADPSLGNQDITKGPVMSALPAPYQPPPATGSWSDQYATAAFRELPPDIAMKAVEAAEQLEGKLGFDADVAAGVPQEKALAKWAPKMYRRNPAVIARLTQPQFQPTTRQVGGQTLIQTSPNRFQIAPQGQPTGPIEAQEVMGPGGQALPGVTGIRGRSGSVHIIPEQKGATSTQLGMLVKHQLDDIQTQLRDVGAEGGIKEDSAEHKALLEDQKKYRQELRRVTEEALQGPKTPHPKAGQIVNGYRFKGGDPKKQSSWEKVS